MVTFILALIFLSFTVPANAQTYSTPVLTSLKAHYEIGEPVRFSYKGSPQKLTATLTDSTGATLPFKAVLHGTAPDSQFLEFESPSATQPGSFHIKISSGLSTLINEDFFRGIQLTATPTPLHPLLSIEQSAHSSLVNSADEEGKIVRSTNTVATPDTTYETKLKYTAEKTGRFILNELVPIDALIDAPEASPSVKPEFLNLRYPFESEYEQTLPFGAVNPAEHFGIPFHDGIDYAVPMDVPIHAVDDGEMVPYREKNSYGITAAIQHTWGRTFYGHLSTTSAQLGTKVRKGDIVGLSGNTGLSSGPHLHFGMMMNDQMIDAAPFMSQHKDNLVASKQLSWELDKQKGQTVEVSYKYTLPQSYDSYSTVPFGPARILDTHESISARERAATNVILSNDSTDMQKIVSDPSYNADSPIAARDGVLLWLDAHDDRILHGFDKVTQTSFTQSIEPDKINSLAIDDKRYELVIVDGAIQLTLH